MSKCVRILVRSRIVGERERVRSRAHNHCIQNSDTKVWAVCVVLALFMLPFSLFNRPFLSYILLPRTLNVSLCLFCLCFRILLLAICRAVVRFAHRVSHSIALGVCTFFVISTLFFSSMNLFCFGRLLSVTITWETDPPFSSFSMIYAIWLVPSIHLSVIFWFIYIEWFLWCEK